MKKTLISLQVPYPTHLDKKGTTVEEEVQYLTEAKAQFLSNFHVDDSDRVIVVATFTESLDVYFNIVGEV